MERQSSGGEEVDRGAAEKMPLPRGGEAATNEKEMIVVGLDALVEEQRRAVVDHRVASPTRRKTKTLEFESDDYFEKDFKEGGLLCKVKHE
jgi:hypothetical protein